MARGYTRPFPAEDRPSWLDGYGTYLMRADSRGARRGCCLQKHALFCLPSKLTSINRPLAGIWRRIGRSRTLFTNHLARHRGQQLLR